MELDSDNIINLSTTFLNSLTFPGQSNDDNFFKALLSIVISILSY